MEQEIIFLDLAICKVDDFKVESVEANSFVAIFAEDHRLAMLQLDGGIIASRFILGVGESTIIEYVAVLVNFDERRALVGSSSL